MLIAILNNVQNPFLLGCIIGFFYSYNFFIISPSVISLEDTSPGDSFTTIIKKHRCELVIGSIVLLMPIIQELFFLVSLISILLYFFKTGPLYFNYTRTLPPTNNSRSNYYYPHSVYPPPRPPRRQPAYYLRKQYLNREFPD